MEKKIVDGVSLALSQPISNEIKWVGQPEAMARLQACWLIINSQDVPLCPRLLGKPGVGKTTLAMAAAQKIKKPLYVYQCTMDTRPEDLLITPVLGEGGKIQYHASPVVSAMIQGGVCILDEGNRMSEKSWASLAPLLDHRRYIESIIAGIKVEAHPEFRCCVTMNDDASTYELPDYIMSRIQPMIEIDFPPREEELKILKYNIPFAEEELLRYTVDFLQKSHQLGLHCSTRDGIHILRYSLKRLAHNPEISPKDVWQESVYNVLGFKPEEIEKMAQKNKKANSEKKLSDLSEFFFDPELFLQGESPYFSDSPPENYEDYEEDDEEDDSI